MYLYNYSVVEDKLVVSLQIFLGTQDFIERKIYTCNNGIDSATGVISNILYRDIISIILYMTGK